MVKEEVEKAVIEGTLEVVNKNFNKYIKRSLKEIGVLDLVDTIKLKNVVQTKLKFRSDGLKIYKPRTGKIKYFFFVGIPKENEKEIEKEIEFQLVFSIKDKWYRWSYRYDFDHLTELMMYKDFIRQTSHFFVDGLDEEIEYLLKGGDLEKRADIAKEQIMTRLIDK